MAANASGVCSTDEWSPMFAMPVVCELKPWAWAPTTASSMPPARPS